jgi:hypothetical protein
MLFLAGTTTTISFFRYLSVIFRLYELSFFMISYLDTIFIYSFYHHLMKYKTSTLNIYLIILIFSFKGLLSLYKDVIHCEIQSDKPTESLPYTCSPWILKMNRKVLIVNNSGRPKKEDTLIIRTLDRFTFDVYMVSVDTFNNIIRVEDLHRFHRIFYVENDVVWSNHFSNDGIICKVRFFPTSDDFNHMELLLDERLHEKNVINAPDLIYSPTRQGLIGDAICSIMEDDSLCNCKESEVNDCRASFFLEKSEVYS